MTGWSEEREGVEFLNKIPELVNFVLSRCFHVDSPFFCFLDLSPPYL